MRAAGNGTALYPRGNTGYAGVMPDPNRMLLAAAAATRQQTRRIITRAAVSWIKRDEMRGRGACRSWCVPQMAPINLRCRAAYHNVLVRRPEVDQTIFP